MIHHSDEIDTSGDRFVVQCPRCEEWFGTYSPSMSYATRHCACGTTFRIDIENERAGEVIECR